MFFGSSEGLEKALHNDLNTLIKNVKLREDQHLSILQYTKNLLSQQKQLDSIAFLHEEITKHKIFLEFMNASHLEIKGEETTVIEKYAGITSSYPSVMKLMNRVTARLLEICQASAEKIQFYDQSIVETHQKIKNLLVELLNEKQKTSIPLLMETIISYTQDKQTQELAKLSRIIHAIEKGNIEEFEKIFSLERREEELPVKTQLQKQAQVPRKKQIEQNQQKFIPEKPKKKKAKVPYKFFGGLYSTMELSKHQYNDDETIPIEEKKKKLYEEIMSRNKFNLEQILAFEAKKLHYELKLKQFKAIMEKESKIIQEALILKKIPIKVQETIDVESEEDQVEIIVPEKQKMFRKRQKKCYTKRPSPSFTKQIAYTSLNSTQEGFKHLKFDLKNQQIFSRGHKGKLPHISGKTIEDDRYLRRKDIRRVNAMKSINMGAFLGGSSKMRSIEKQDRKQTIRDRSEGSYVPEYTLYKTKFNKFTDRKTKPLV